MTAYLPSRNPGFFVPLEGEFYSHLEKAGGHARQILACPSFLPEKTPYLPWQSSELGGIQEHRSESNALYKTSYHE
jgi:hypothetical protein